MAGQIFAAIDVGSFELEMGIYEMSGKSGIRKLDHIRHVIALGRDTYNNGKISYEMVEELCQVLGDFTKIMKSYGAEEYRAYATSAMREAKNSQIVLEQIRLRTGLTVRIISNSEQRFVGYKSIAAADEEFDVNIRQGTAILDVGFGSMQISLFDKNLLISTMNLPLGVLRLRGTLSALNMAVDRTEEIIGEMVEGELETYKKMYLKDREIKHLIGIGESILYLFRHENGGKPLNQVSREQFDQLYSRLFKMNPAQIEEQFAVSREYASLLLPATVIYKKFMDLTGAEMIWVPGIRLCDGIAAEYAAEKKFIKFKHNFDNDIISTSRNMAKRYKCLASHTETVENFALQLFDSMKKYHGMGTKERLLLQIAAILHECGKFVSVRNANECAYRLIMATEIIGLSHLEREIVANVVRYNIRDFEYDMIRLEAEELSGQGKNGGQTDVRILIAKLTALLRQANSMDRSHKGKLKGCRMTVKDGRLVIVSDYPGDISLEASSFEQKASFFEEIFGIRPVLKKKKSR